MAKKNDTETYLTHNEEKSIVAERFIRNIIVKITIQHIFFFDHRFPLLAL